MAWVKIDDKFTRHPKIAAVMEKDPVALVLWLAGACHCAEFETDGLITNGAAALLPMMTPERIKLLLTVGLWVPAEGGYHYHDWLRYQISHEEAEKKRAQIKGRVDKFRGRNADGNGVTHASGNANGNGVGNGVTSGSGSGSSSGSSEIGKSARKGRAATTVITIPLWLPAEAWAEWLAHRRAKGKLTPQCEVAQLAKLGRLRAQGHDPKAMIDRAIESNWSSFFPPKDGAAADEDDGPTYTPIEEVIRARKS